MKQSVFKAIHLRLMLLRVNTINTWRMETAYFGDAWGNVLSTMAFTITFLVFVNIIYANVTTLAGYTKDQMLFLELINQLSFYSIYAWGVNNIQDMINDVNDGSFDLLLVKPVPALFYTSIKNISMLTIMRDGIPSLLFIVLAINWHNITVAPADLLIGLIIFATGQVALSGLLLLIGLPVFWFGQAADTLGLSYPFLSLNLPYEGVGSKLKLGLTLLIPALVPASLATSVMLHKSNAWWGLALAVLAAMILTGAKQWGWKRALASYTSASS